MFIIVAMTTKVLHLKEVLILNQAVIVKHNQVLFVPNLNQSQLL